MKKERKRMKKNEKEKGKKKEGQEERAKRKKETELFMIYQFVPVGFFGALVGSFVILPLPSFRRQ